MKYFLATFIRRSIIKSYVVLVRLTTRVIKNRIVLHQPFKFGYDCNQKYIAEEILRQKLPYEIIWITRATRANGNIFPEKIKVVTEDKIFEALFYILTAKICITNVFYPFGRYLQKRKGQLYINTWHGSLGIKKVGLEEKYTNRSNTNSLIENINKTDIFISNSSFETDVYRNSLLYRNKIIEIGHPRNDILINGVLSEKQIKQIKEKVGKYENYNIPIESKTVLYAPTFRNNYDLNCFNMDYELLLKSLREKFNEDFILMLRLHPSIRNKFKNYKITGNQIFDYTNYGDIQELMIRADVMITDYSSCIFDYILTGKPGFIYASDIEEYDQTRGFYYPLESTPFPIIKNNDELRERILNFDSSKYTEDVEKFLEEKGCIEDGNASKKVVEIIKNGDI